MLNKKGLIALVLIILLATVLRIYRLDNVPPALFGDEVDVGFQAYSLLKTGQDLSGRTLPFYIKSLSEYRAPLYIYSAVPFIGIFGLNEWGVRLPAVFWGIVSILGLYLLTKKILDYKIALIAAAVLSISPWHLQYSRASFEVTLLLSLLIFATYFFILGLDVKKYFLVSAVCFGLTFYTYSTANVFTPLWVLTLIAIYHRRLSKIKVDLLVSGLLLGLIVLPIFISVISGEARERFGLVSIFQDKVLEDKINLARVGQEFITAEGEKKIIDPTFEFLYHNKPIIFTQVFSLNYLRALSPDFLFGQGDPNFRHAIHEMGLLYLFELILLILGVWYILKIENKSTKLVIFSWLLLAPIPASLTYDGGFHATRLFIMIPPLLMLVSFGLYQLIQSSQKLYKPILVIVGLLAIINITTYLHRYYIHYPIESWRWWHVGFKEAVSYIHENQENYQTIILNNTYEPSLVRYLFYTNYDPALFHSQFKGEKVIQNILPGMDGFSLDDKIYFGTLSDETKASGGFEAVMRTGMLYMASARDEAGVGFNTYDHNNFKIVKTIFDPSGVPIFYLLAGKGDEED